MKIEFNFDDHSECVESIRPGSSESTHVGLQPSKSPFYYVPSRRYFTPAFGRNSPMERDTFMFNYTSNTTDALRLCRLFEGRLFQIEQDQERFNKVIRKIIPDILTWSIDQHETNQYFFRFVSNDRSHSSEGVGEGIISIFVIAGALYDSRPGDVVIIDEPELSLHPQTQRRLMRLIEKSAADRQISLQLIRRISSREVRSIAGA